MQIVHDGGDDPSGSKRSTKGVKSIRCKKYHDDRSGSKRST